jgi:hypothetical protein
MSAMNVNTANNTLRQLLGNGLVYRVPPFQRDYSWSTGMSYPKTRKRAGMASMRRNTTALSTGSET